MAEDQMKIQGTVWPGMVMPFFIIRFTKIRTGLANRNLRRVLEVLLLILAAGTILTIAFLDLIALGVIGPVPN